VKTEVWSQKAGVGAVLKRKKGLAGGGVKTWKRRRRLNKGKNKARKNKRGLKRKKLKTFREKPGEKGPEQGGGRGRKGRKRDRSKGEKRCVNFPRENRGKWENRDLGDHVIAGGFEERKVSKRGEETRLR